MNRNICRHVKCAITSALQKLMMKQTTERNCMLKYLLFSVTADEDGPDNHVRVCVVFPGLKKKFFKNAAKNAVLDIKYETR